MTRDRLIRDIARELMFAERTNDIFENFCWPEGMTQEDKQQAVQEAKQIRICPIKKMETKMINSETDYYIVRCTGAGVYLAKVDEMRGDIADLSDARLIHYYCGATATLGVALNGLSEGSRITLPVERMTVLGVCAIIPVTKKALASILAVEPWSINP